MQDSSNNGYRNNTGSGVGNRRAELCKRTMGIPVIAVGFQQSWRATLAADLMESAGMGEIDPEIFGKGGDMIVTPKEIDVYMDDISKFLDMVSI